jgi:hypothetical protein
MPGIDRFRMVDTNNITQQPVAFQEQVSLNLPA